MPSPNKNLREQCPHCKSPSEEEDGVFVCRKGHQWTPELAPKLTKKLYDVPLISDWDEKQSDQAKEDIDQLRLAGFKVRKVGLVNSVPCYLVQRYPEIDVEPRDLSKLGSRRVGRLPGEDDPSPVGLSD